MSVSAGKFGRLTLTLFLATLALSSLLSVGCSGEIRIGAVVSESGGMEVYGKEVRRGLELAAEEVNAAGGFEGSPVQLIFRDDMSHGTGGEQAVRELIETEKVDMIIGAIGSPVTLRIAPICEEAEVVLLSPTASNPKISTAGDYIFRNYPSDVLEGTAMAQFARDQGFEKVVIFALDSDFGTGLVDVFVKEYESKYRKVVGSYRFPEGTTDFEAMVQEAVATKPDAAYIVTYDAEMTPLLQAIEGTKTKMVMMGTSAFRPEALLGAGEAAENLIYPKPGHFDPESRDRKVSDFVTAYRQKYNQDPDLFAAQGYDALYIMLEAIKNGGSTHPINVKVGMSAIDGFQGAGGRTAFDVYGDVVRYPRLFVIHEGKATPYERFVEDGHSLL